MSDQFGMDIIVNLEEENTQLREQIKVLYKALDKCDGCYAEVLVQAKKQIEEEGK